MASFGFESGFKSPSALESTKSMMEDLSDGLCVFSPSRGKLLPQKSPSWGKCVATKKNHIFHFTLCCPERDGLLTAFDAPMRPWENLAA